MLSHGRPGRGKRPPPTTRGAWWIAWSAATTVLLLVGAHRAPSYAEGSAGTYASTGCVACHGSRAQGAEGPRLIGTTRSLDWFIRYVRDPVGKMPSFGTDQISDQELTAIWKELSAKDS